MAASPVSPRHPPPQPTITPPPAPNQGAGGSNNANGATARDSQPTQSSHTAPGTGLVVDKHV